MERPPGSVTLKSLSERVGGKRDVRTGEGEGKKENERLGRLTLVGGYLLRVSGETEKIGEMQKDQDRKGQKSLKV